MKEYVGVLVWALATILLAIALTYGYNKSREVEMTKEYRCYLNIEKKEGWYEGMTRLTKTRGELEMLTPGADLEGYTVSRQELNNTSADIYLDEVDNPTLEPSKMTCFSS